MKKDFDEKRSAGQFPGWRVDTGSVMVKYNGAILDLTTFPSPDNLMSWSGLAEFSSYGA